jgi:anthranilate phosphoribosyltransferase
MRPEQQAGPVEHPFAGFVRTLGRGPGRSRSLTRDEAREAMAMVLAGAAEPVQIGAFLMLLRFRGEDPEEMAGLTEAARAVIGAGLPEGAAPVDLDWPSYGAGRTRGAPWYLLAALALARAGTRVLMHGSNAFTAGIEVPSALVALGLRPAADRDDAARLLDETGFAYLPLQALSPALDAMLGLRGLLGLRSPVNTVARLLDPFDARAGVDGVFHPGYIALHLAAAQRLGRSRLLVLKGGGGEAERNPGRATTAHVLSPGGCAELALPASGTVAGSRESGLQDLVRIWHGDEPDGPGAATATGTIALALLAMGVAQAPEQADAFAAAIWQSRRP